MKIIQAGVIGCDISGQEFQDLNINKLESFNWKKIYISDNIHESIVRSYPATEFVSDINTIVDDDEISLVFVSPQHLDLASQVMKAGKSVRVI